MIARIRQELRLLRSDYWMSEWSGPILIVGFGLYLLALLAIFT